MSDWYISAFCIASYVPGYFLTRWMQKTSNENLHPGDEIGPGGALMMWLFSPIMVPFLGVLFGWFGIANLLFPERGPGSESRRIKWPF